VLPDAEHIERDAVPQQLAAGHGQRLSRDQEKAIAALLVAPTLGDAADKAGVHPNTLRAWSRQPAFASAYAEARQELLRRTVHRMQTAMLTAVAALEKDCGSEVFEQRFKAAELLSLMDRIEGLEKLARGEGGDEVA
jgi:hypothetical protein